MPQPLSKFPLLKGLYIGNDDDAPSRHRPKLALLAMQVIAEWSILESSMAGLLVKLLGANPGPAAAMYASLTGATQQKAAFRAIADLVITDRTLKDVFEGILSVYTALGRERNKLAHWTWGHSPDIPDGVLLADPRALMAYNVAMKIALDNMRAGGKIELVNRIPKDDIFVYKEVDFVGMSERINALMGYVQDLGFVLTGHVANRDGELLRQLLAVPEIKEVVDRLCQRRKTEQEAQQPQPEKPQSTGKP